MPGCYCCCHVARTGLSGTIIMKTWISNNHKCCPPSHRSHDDHMVAAVVVHRLHCWSSGNTESASVSVTRSAWIQGIQKGRIPQAEVWRSRELQRLFDNKLVSAIRNNVGVNASTPLCMYLACFDHKNRRRSCRNCDGNSCMHQAWQVPPFWEPPPYPNCQHCVEMMEAKWHFIRMNCGADWTWTVS